jgi:hypothetical protein
MASYSIGASTSAKEIPVSRPLRIEYAGALYHITSRGNERRAIYRRREDRIRILQILFSVCDRYAWLCHAYCLMGNYYHLLIETQAPNLSQGMRKLNDPDDSSRDTTSGWQTISIASTAPRSPSPIPQAFTGPMKKLASRASRRPSTLRQK